MPRSARVRASGLLVVLLGACGEGSPYLKPGEPFATRYVIPEERLMADTPAGEAWIAYNLGLAVCSLEDETSNGVTFACECRARELLVRAWRDAQLESPGSDAYLDALTRVAGTGFIDEYVWAFLRRRSWQRPDGLERKAFSRWRKANLPNHRVQTVRLGFWVD